MVGTESCGKSTLVRNLAKIYNTNFVGEYGREFYEEIGTGITLLEDYPLIAYKHKVMENEGLKHANRVLFVDTEANVTNYYSALYHGEYQDVVQEVANSQDYDLWLFLEPDVRWVDDGMRKNSDQEERQSLSNTLKQNLRFNNIEFTEIDGNYAQRLHKAMRAIDKVLNH